MEYVYAAMLLHKAGKQITEDSMDKVLIATGVAVDKARVKATVTALKDVDINKVIKEATLVTAAAAPAAGPAPKAEKKEEEKKVSEEEAAAGLGALFG
jgi:large subunit ribosomal protein L12